MLKNLLEILFLPSLIALGYFGFWLLGQIARVMYVF